MDLAHLPAAACPSLRIAVLAVLGSRRLPIGLRTIWLGTRGAGTYRGVNKALTALIAEGLVEHRVSVLGRGYRLNRDHVLAPMAVALAAVRPILLRQVAVVVKQAGGVRAAWLTGGLAGGWEADDVLRVAVEPGAGATLDLQRQVRQRLERLSDQRLGGTPVEVTLLVPGDRPQDRSWPLLPWAHAGPAPW